MGVYADVMRDFPKWWQCLWETWCLTRSFFWYPILRQTQHWTIWNQWTPKKCADFTTRSSCFHGVMGQVLAPEVYHCLDPTKYLYRRYYIYNIHVIWPYIYICKNTYRYINVIWPYSKFHLYLFLLSMERASPRIIPLYPIPPFLPPLYHEIVSHYVPE